jgi:hypothetical protein
MATIPSLALLPSGYKASKVYSVLPTDGTGDFDFTRSGNATRVNSEGLIELVSTNVPRLNYPLIDGVVSGCPSLLLEPQRSNLVPYSQEFTGWTLTNVVETPNDLISPDGTQNASKFVTNNNGVDIKYASIPVVQNTTYTFSFYCNYIGGLGLQGRFFDNTNGANIEYYDYMSQLEEGKWKRVTRTFTTPIGCTNIQVWYLASSSSNPVTAYYWGAQLEQGSYATSYIPNYGTALGVTRSAETCNNAGDASTFNSAEGVLMFEGSALANDGTFRILSLSNGGTSNEIKIQLSSVDNTIGYGVVVGGFPQIDSFYTTNSTLLNNKIAAKYKENDFSLFVNGFEVIVDTNGSVFSQGTLNELSFERGNNTSPFYSSTKQIQYFDSALNDSDLEKLTSWVSFTDMANGQLYTIE